MISYITYITQIILITYANAELIDLFQRNGIDNPITGEPIIIEHSPGNMIVEKAGDKIEMKICLENGSLSNLY